MDRRLEGIGSHDAPLDVRAEAFVGFLPLTGNFLYCPNQFFDVVLAHHSRGVVRLVGHLLRRTLGWLDAHGNPIEEKVSVSYQELADAARISTGVIRQALDDAIESKLIRCVREGRANEKGRAGEAARYELRWDVHGLYTKDPGSFRGFFGGEGNRSPIPNDFFDRVIPNEPLAVIQVVGAVLRHTVGYQNHFGGRRQQAPLSHSYIQQFTGIRGRHHVQAAIRSALDSNYIRLVQAGTFDPRAGSKGLAAQYAVKWAEFGGNENQNTSKRLPAHSTANGDGRAQKGDQRILPKQREKVTSERREKVTENALKWLPAEHRKEVTEEKTSSKNTSQRQQQTRAAVVSALMKEGFDRRVATSLAARFAPEEIQRQIEWLPLRRASQNRLGMLRRAIDEQWAAPEGKLRTSEVSPASVFAENFYAGLAGNPRAAIAIPSDNDLNAATRLLERLAETDSDPSSVERLGRGFGEFTRTARAGQRNPLNSLAVAARSFGDQFFTAELKRSETRKANAAREQGVHRRAKLQQEYADYLARVDRNLSSSRPDDYERFLGWRSDERKRYAASRVGQKHLLAWFDSLQKKLEDVRLYFDKETLSFEAWLAARRNEGQQACESSPSSTPREVAARAPSR